MLPFVIKYTENFQLLSGRVAVEKNMNLSSFSLVVLNNQGEFLSGKHCSIKWALGSSTKSTGFCVLSTWPPKKSEPIEEF